MGGEHGHPHAADLQVNDLGCTASAERRTGALRGQLERGEHLVQRPLALVLEHPAG
jgi:hypothetical protein